MIPDATFAAINAADLPVGVKWRMADQLTEIRHRLPTARPSNYPASRQHPIAR